MTLPGFEEETIYRHCIKCNKLLPLNDSSFRIDKKYTNLKYRTVCRNCEVVGKREVRNLKKRGLPSKPKCCELCSATTDKLVIDHCHESKEFRGYLCGRCNSILGHVRDDAELLLRMSAYILTYKEKYNETDFTDIIDINFYKLIEERYPTNRSDGKGLSTLFDK